VELIYTLTETTEPNSDFIASYYRDNRAAIDVVFGIEGLAHNEQGFVEAFSPQNLGINNIYDVRDADQSLVGYLSAAFHGDLFITDLNFSSASYEDLLPAICLIAAANNATKWRVAVNKDYGLVDEATSLFNRPDLIIKTSEEPTASSTELYFYNYELINQEAQS